MPNMGYELFIVLKDPRTISVRSLESIFHFTVTYFSTVHLISNERNPYLTKLMRKKSFLIKEFLITSWIEKIAKKNKGNQTD